MNMEELFSGVAVVIDDEYQDSKANINKIIAQIERAKIPLLKYDALPDNNIVDHFQNLSFLLLDWRLKTNKVSIEEITEGVKSPEGLQEYDSSENLQFIQILNEKCFCPIFIFTNDDASSINNQLIGKGLIKEGSPSNLFVQSKSDLQDDGALYKKITSWLEQTPSMYVLKEWEKEYQSCKIKLFYDLHSLNPSWPTIMWETFGEDGANKSLEMGELISRNLHSRMTPFKFNKSYLDKQTVVPRDELRKVLEGERFLRLESLHEDDIGTGDLFKDQINIEDKEEFCYYLNIRAQCDLLRGENPELFILSGFILKQNENGKISNISFNKGEYLEKSNHAVVAFIDGGNILEFKFNTLKIVNWNELKTKRIGRLLPPYINRIQQRYSLYMQRQGLPRIPPAAIFGSSSDRVG